MLTIAAVAENKGIAPERIEVWVRRETTEGLRWRTRFVVGVELGAGLSHRERKILFNVARRCEVHKLLSGELDFEYRGDGIPTAGKTRPVEPTGGL